MHSKGNNLLSFSCPVLTPSIIREESKLGLCTSETKRLKFNKNRCRIKYRLGVGAVKSIKIEYETELTIFEKIRKESRTFLI